MTLSTLEVPVDATPELRFEILKTISELLFKPVIDEKS
jgi:hypothetical protein